MSDTKIIRMEEVEKNTNSTWMVIHNSVYDVSAYLNEHPGGEDVLRDQAGRDDSEDFDDVGHSSVAREIMAKYKIGELHKDDIVKSGYKTSDLSSRRGKMRNYCVVTVFLAIAATVVAMYKGRLSR